MSDNPWELLTQRERIRELEKEVSSIRSEREYANNRIADLIYQIFVLKKKVEDWNSIDRPVYEKANKELYGEVENLRQKIKEERKSRDKLSLEKLQVDMEVLRLRQYQEKVRSIPID